MKKLNIKLYLLIVIAALAAVGFWLYLNKYLYKPKASSPTPTVTWDPMSRPTLESDTLFLPDLTSLKTINAGGGWLAGTPGVTGQTNLQGNYDFGPGKFGPAVRAHKTGSDGTINEIFYPMDGLIPGDEWTAEFWTKSDEPWSQQLSDSVVFGFDNGDDGNLMRFGPTSVNENGTNSIQCRLLALANPLSGYIPDGKSTFKEIHAPCEQWGLTQGVWAAVGLVYKNGTLTLYVNGDKKGELSGMNWYSVWSDGGRGTQGIRIGGLPVNTAWVSDVRISRTARVPNQAVPLHSVDSSVTVDAGSVAKNVPSNFTGALHTSWPSVTRSQFESALPTIRTAGLLGVTPMKQGGTDGDHPTPGCSGQFSYDWQVVDRTYDYITSRGALPTPDIDSTPSILGGAQGPYTHGGGGGRNLDSDMATTGGINPQLPNDLGKWQTIVSDLVCHTLREKGIAVPFWRSWNEPDGDYWQASSDNATNRSKFMDMYAATSRGLKAIDPTAVFGGPELGGLHDAEARTWVKELFERAHRDNLALDYISYHHFSNDVSHIDQAQRYVDYYAAQNGFTTPFPVMVGEFNLQNENLYKPDSAYLYNTDFWTLKSFGAAHTTQFLIHALETPGTRNVSFALTGGPYFGSPHTGGYATTALFGAQGEQWAPYNAFKGWKTVTGSQVLNTPIKDLAPGVFGIATKEPGTGKIGLSFSNFGYAQRQSRKVNINLKNLGAGTYHFKRYLVDQTHSSRWDCCQDQNTAQAQSQDDLATVEDRNTDSQRGTITFLVDLPQWSSTFISLEPGAGTIQPTSAPTSTPIQRLTYPTSMPAQVQPTLTPTIIASTTVQAPVTLPFRMRMGGPAFTDSLGNEFQAERFADGGETNCQAQGIDIKNTVDDPLYQCERWGDRFKYHIPIANGTHVLRLHFAEIFSGCADRGVGCRVFGLQAEGQQLLSAFDIYKEAGAYNPIIKEYSVAVTDGVLDLDFLSQPSAPKISALELDPGSVSLTPISNSCRHDLGDANCDGKVDIVDFELWRREFTGAVSTKLANFNSDAKVDLVDFEIWRQGYIH